jgi:hypothetical protein
MPIMAIKISFVLMAFDFRTILLNHANFQAGITPAATNGRLAKSSTSLAISHRQFIVDFTAQNDILKVSGVSISHFFFLTPET